MLIFRQNKYFKINTSELSAKANNSAIINGLYADMYVEFRGADKNPKYSHLTYLERMEAIETYAQKWLEDRGLK